jgi:hypothetical protein
MRLFMLTSSDVMREVVGPSTYNSDLVIVAFGDGTDTIGLYPQPREDKAFPEYDRGDMSRMPFGSPWTLYEEHELVALRLLGKTLTVVRWVETGE